MYRDDYPTCAKTYATLIIAHEDLDPALVTGELLIEPSRAWRRGEPRNPRSSRPAIARIGEWRLSTQDRLQSQDVRRHVDWILDQVEPQTEALQGLQAQGYTTEIACYWLSASGHGGPTLSPGTLSRLGGLGLTIWFDFYYLPDEEVKGGDDESTHDPGASERAIDPAEPGGDAP